MVATLGVTQSYPISMTMRTYIRGMEANLNPRAIAILVALRRGPRSIGQLADSIADDDMADTARLLGVMELTHMVICRLPVGTDNKIRFMLNDDGIKWLQLHERTS